MSIGLLLFLGGIGIVEALILLVVGFVPFYFIARAILRKVVDGKMPVNIVAAIIAALLSPVVLVILAGTVALIYTSQQMNDYENFRDSVNVDHFVLSADNAHENAQKIMDDDFYWEMDQSSPFESYEGYSTFYQYHDWSKQNKDQSPMIFLDQLIQEWGFEKFDMTRSTPEEVATLMTTVPSSVIREVDQAMIAIGFGQLVLEGKMGNDVKEATKNALRRQLAPKMLNTYKIAFRDDRQLYLEQMLKDVETVPASAP